MHAIVCVLCVAAPAGLAAQLLTSGGRIEPTLLYDRDFAADPTLVAKPGQGVVFTADPTQGLGRLRLPAGRHRFCAAGGGGHITAIVLQPASRRTVIQRLNRNGCAQVTLPAGVVSIRLQRGSGPEPPAWATAVVRADSPSTPISPVPLVGPDNSPVDGYWAIQDTTFNARGTFGNRVLSTAPGPSAELLVDPSTTFNGRSLLQLPQVNGAMIPALLESSSDFWSVFFSQPYVVNPCDDYCGYAYNPLYYLQIADLGNYAFTFDIKSPLPAGLVGGANASGAIQLTPTFAASGGDSFQVLFRFHPEGYPFDGEHLQNSEIVLYQGCQFGGRASIFIPLLGAGVVSPPYDLTALSSSVTTLDATGKAALIGPGGSFYWGPSASNPQGAVVSNTACLTTSPSGNLFVEPVSNTLVVAHDLLNKSCALCVLSGQSLNLTAGSPAADFSGWNFADADFSHSVLSNLDLSGANLSGAKFVGATLTNVKLSRVQLTAGLDFSGATLTGVTFDGSDVTNFKFPGATLSQINLSSSVVSGSGLDFTGATLNQVSLNGMNPAGLTMINVNLCGVGLTGSDADHLLDLTSGNFAGAHVTLSSACAANLSYTNLTPAATIGSSWTGLNLTGTTVNGLSGRVLSTQTSPIDLSGATLAGVSLQGAILDYAKFQVTPNLTAAHFNNGSLRFVDLQGAKLYGANLTNANLEGANLNGAYLTKVPTGSGGAATLSGAFLRNVNLSQAQLSGAIFTDADFYSASAVGTNRCTPGATGFTPNCATASGAIMDGTVFDGAYLFGVDFTQSTAQGVNFGNSYLAGANFSGATLTASTSGTDTGFSGAFLQGTNMSGLILQNGVSLRNAFVDFSPAGNILFLILNGNHTTFAGYWNTPGEAVCAEMSYSAGPTTVPTTTPQITCPDGNQYIGGCGPAASDGSNTHWESRVDITAEASYEFNATYTNAPSSGNPICSVDKRWVPLTAGSPGPKPWRPHPPLPIRPVRPEPPLPIQSRDNRSHP